MMKLPKLNVKSIALKPRERLLAAVTGLIFLVIVLDRLVISPWYHHAQTIQQEIQRVEQALQTQRQLLARRAQILAAHERYQRYLKPAIADDLQMATLLREVEELARASNTRVVEVKPSDVETTALAKRYILDVQFECTLEACVTFIYRIEASTSLFEVVRGGLARDEEVPSQLVGSLRLMSAVPRTPDDAAQL